MIRLRRIPPGRWRRKLYEYERLDPDTGEFEHRITRYPELEIDEHLGVAEAWALIHAANRQWDDGRGGWLVDVPNNEAAFRALDEADR